MFYEDCVINSVLHYRHIPGEPWRAMTAEQVTERLVDERAEHQRLIDQVGEMQQEIDAQEAYLAQALSLSVNHLAQ
jgi:hypothetical protein